MQGLPPTSPAATQVIDYLRLVDEPPLASEIAAGIGCDLKTVQNALTKAVGEPGSMISRIGRGTKNDPYRYLLEDEALAS